ncbi:MAG TPA: hypothetical protein VFG43_01755 [Geminicoccaceae bacterium]|jgi:hypothetical protein|nr:hypothetical protein [Geminicoccaceae bacterium]
MSPNPSEPVFCFSVLSEAQPSTLCRVFDVFSVHGLVPSRCHTEVAAGGQLAIDLQVAGVHAELAEKLARRLERVVTVSHVLVSEKQLLNAA